MTSTYLLFMRHLAVELPIGLHQFERAAPQRVLLDVAVRVQSPLNDSDDIAGTFDYDLLTHFIRDLAAGGQIQLQETLCHRILAWCMAQPKVTGAVVRSAKPDVYPDMDEVGCCIAMGDAELSDLLVVDRGRSGPE